MRKYFYLHKRIFSIDFKNVLWIYSLKKSIQIRQKINFKFQIATKAALWKANLKHLTKFH